MRPPHRRKSASGMISRKIATHLTASHGSISSRSPNFVPARGISRLIGTLVGLIAASSNAISTRCSRRLAEVQDAADAGLEPRLADRLDRAQTALVADRRGDLGVEALGRLDVVVDALDAGLAQRPGALDRDVADRRAAFEVGVLGDQARAREDLLEVARGEALALGDHAEAVRAGGLGGARVLEHLLGLHHRVHRRVRVGVARLRAEAAVLGAAARLGVHQRAHVGRVAEALDARVPAALDERLDLGRARSARPARSASSRVISGAMRRTLLEHDERVALVDRLALVAADLRDRPGVLGLDRHLHLHRLEHDERRRPRRPRSPTAHSIFQTTPVMCAGTSTTTADNSFRRRRPRGAMRRRAAGPRATPGAAAP